MARPVIPIANLDTKPFWDACAEGRLMLQRCAACQAWRHPPSPICPECLSDAHEWVAASGRGTVYTFVVVREARRGWDKMVPYVLAVVALDEGPRILTNLAEIAPEDVAIGLPVEVTFEELDGTTKLPLFRPAPQGAPR
ncbi:MAG TPA: Zn-ribbon domain-containing OB-fold protein [Stellaceae bacterium]|nr:Zn-ribbon domain-containing OB-fold protein [Stellaceae bacterium]